MQGGAIAPVLPASKAHFYKPALREFAVKLGGNRRRSAFPADMHGVRQFLAKAAQSRSLGTG